MVWFLGAYHGLVQQSQLPAARTRLLVGSANLDRCKDKIWKAVLSDVRIVISTHAVLLETLGNSYGSI